MLLPFCNKVRVQIIFLVPQAGIENEVEHNNAKHILLEMGEFFQIQVLVHIHH